MPANTVSPNQWFNACADFAGDINLPLGENDFIDLMPSKTRVIGSTGVQYLNRHYDSDQLHPFRGQPSNLPHLNNEWEMKFNPRDVTRVWVRSPENEWIECRWTQADSIFQPHYSDIQQNLAKTEENEEAEANARRAGAVLPTVTQEPQPRTVPVDWDQTQHVDLEMFEVEEESTK